MYQKVLPLVLWAAYDPIRFTDWTQVKVVECVFASYLEEDEVNAAYASRIMNGEITRTMMYHYADAEFNGCPEALYLDVSTFVYFAYQFRLSEGGYMRNCWQCWKCFRRRIVKI